MSDNFKKKLKNVLRDANIGSIEQARAGMEQIVAANQDSEGSWIILASIYYIKDDYPEAERSFSNVLRLNPENDLASLGYFHCLWQQQRQQEALQEIKRFVSTVDPDQHGELLKEYRSLVEQIRSGN